MVGWGQLFVFVVDGVLCVCGLVLYNVFGFVVVQVVEVLFKDGKLCVYCVVCVVDCGMVVNFGIVVQQMEGGIIFGLSVVLYGQIQIKDGWVI